jgi:hypothetical protein
MHSPLSAFDAEPAAPRLAAYFGSRAGFNKAAQNGCLRFVAAQARERSQAWGSRAFKGRSRQSSRPRPLKDLPASCSLRSLIRRTASEERHRGLQTVCRPKVALLGGGDGSLLSGRFLRKQAPKKMAFPHQQSAKEHCWKEDESSRPSVQGKLIKWAVNIAVNWDCDDDVNPAKN